MGILYRRGRFEAEQPKRKQNRFLTPTKYDEHPPSFLNESFPWRGVDAL